MSTLSSVKYNLDTLYKCKNEFDWLMAQKEVPVRKLDKLFKLKKDMLYQLSCILSVNAEEILSNSFYTSVNFVEQGIINILNKKEAEILDLQKSHNVILSDAKRIISILYSMDILQNSIHIDTENEEKLITLKTAYISLHNANQKEIALNFLKKVVQKYRIGYFKILKLVSLHSLKEELSFEDKQEIFEVFSSISFDYQLDKLRNKVYMENKENSMYDKYTSDYLRYFEEMFLNLASICKINLPSFYYQIENEIKNVELNELYINTSIEYICKKYDFDITNEINETLESKVKSEDKIKSTILSLIKYSGVTDLSSLLSGIRETNMLPEYLKDAKEYEKIYKIVEDTDFLLNKDVQVYTVLDEISSFMTEEFDADEYLKGYKYNENNSVRQIAYFRQYYISLLESTKNKVLKSYEEKIEEIISKSEIKNYDIKKRNNYISDKKIKIDILKDALKYINDNFRAFTSNNLKIYTKAIQKRYHVEELYENIVKRKQKNNFSLRTKTMLEEEKEYIKSFIENDTIKKDLINEIVDTVIVDDESIKKEILDLV